MSLEVAKVQLKWNNIKLNELRRDVLEGMFAMAFDIETEAKNRAPYVTGALSNSIRTEENGNVVAIKAGGIVSQSSRGPKLVNYAIKREKGPNRNPATEHYMENAAKTIMRGNYMAKYFKKGVK